MKKVGGLIVENLMSKLTKPYRYQNSVVLA